MGLPPLRTELELIPGPRRRGGDPTWLLYDPIRNLYINIGWLEYAFLSRWHLGQPDKIVADVLATTTLDAHCSDITQFVGFLSANECLGELNESTAARIVDNQLARESRRGKAHFQRQLFRRFPLLHPDRFLDGSMPMVALLSHRHWKRCCALLVLVCIFVIAREWQTFKSDVATMFAWQNVPLLFAALALTKCIHEFGHAYACKRFGLSVPTMGIAIFIVWPFLYTDTTSSWRLTNKRERIRVGLAGVVAETYAAVFCLAGWVLLSPGPLRSTLLFIGTVSLLTTLLVNINPFMRWDGYFVLADAWGIDNLQSRAFALGRWRLRQWMFGVVEPCPDHLDGSTRHWVIVYAYLTWSYRVALFGSMAYLAYAFLFKAIGLLAFTLVLYWFIAKPVLTEFIYLTSNRHKMSWNRHSIGFVVILAVLVASAWAPLDRSVSMKAQLMFDQRATIYPPYPAKIASVFVTHGQNVQRGDALFELVAPENDYQIRKSALAERHYTALLARLGDRQILDEKNIIKSRLTQVRNEREGLESQRRRLNIHAIEDGLVARLSDYARAGVWVSEDTPLAFVINRRALALTAYLDQRDLARVAVGAVGKFVPEDPAQPPLEVELTQIDRDVVDEMEAPGLSAVHGGDVVIRDRADGRLVPASAVYRLRLELRVSNNVMSELAASGAVRGTVHLEANPTAAVDALGARIVGLFVRESGF